MIFKLFLKHQPEIFIPGNSFVCSLLAILLDLPVDSLTGLINFSRKMMLVALVTSHGFSEETLVFLHIFLVFRLSVMKLLNTIWDFKLFSRKFDTSSCFSNLFLVFWKCDYCSSSCYFFADSALIPAFDFFPLFELDFGSFLNVLELCFPHSLVFSVLFAIELVDFKYGEIFCEISWLIALELWSDVDV